jgi:hypothetical protein
MAARFARSDGRPGFRGASEARAVDKMNGSVQLNDVVQ